MIAVGSLAAPLISGKEKNSISIKPIVQSIQGENNQVIAQIYYEKPVISGDAHGIKAIKDYFDVESRGWLGDFQEKLKNPEIP